MKTLSPLKFFNLTLLLTGLILLSPILLVVVFYPFFVYHKPWFVKVENPHGQDRMQNAGLINHWLNRKDGPINTIIVGTSMSQNFPLDKHTLRLTLSGGRPLEIRSIAERAIATGKVKTVIWEVFWPYITQDPAEQHPESPLPLYLYNDTLWDDWRYFLNADVVEYALKTLVRPEKARRPMSEIYTWGRKEYGLDFEKYSSADNIAQMNKSIRNRNDMPLRQNAAEKGTVSSFPNIDENLLPVLRANPDIRFIIYFPPMPYYGYLLEGNDRFWMEMNMRDYLLKSVAGMKNVSVHGFDLIDGLGNKLSRYKDSQHYEPEANEMMLNAMMAEKFTLTDKNFAQYRRDLTNRLNKKYDEIRRLEKP